MLDTSLVQFNTIRLLDEIQILKLYGMQVLIPHMYTDTHFWQVLKEEK